MAAFFAAVLANVAVVLIERLVKHVATALTGAAVTA